MSAADPAHTDAPKPLIYAAPCLVLAGGTFTTGVVYLVLAIDNPNNISARLLSSILLVLGVLGAGFTSLCWRVDVAHREARRARVKAGDHAEKIAAEVGNEFGRRLDELAGLVHSTVTQQQTLTRMVTEAMDAAKTNRDVLRQWTMAQRPDRGQRRRARGSRGPSGEEIDRFLSAMDSGDNVVPMPDPKKIRGNDEP